jgi:hypothetical protein
MPLGAGRDLPREGRPPVDQDFHRLLRKRNPRHDLIGGPIGGMGNAIAGAEQKHRTRDGGGSDVDELGRNGSIHEIPLSAGHGRLQFDELAYRWVMFRIDFVSQPFLFRICFLWLTAGGLSRGHPDAEPRT